MRFASRRPNAAEYGSIPDFARIIEAVDGEDVMAVLPSQMYWLGELAMAIGADQVDRVHAPYTWTIRQVFEHGADAERVFGYRAMRIAAGDQTPLPGWDETAYAEARFGLGASLAGLVDEWTTQRRSNYLLLRRIEPAAWDRSAQANGVSVTVRTVAWLMAAHLQHHLSIVEARLGVSVPRQPMPNPQQPTQEM